MRVLTLPAVADMAQRAADVIGAAVAERPALVLGLPTGKTVIPLYGELALTAVVRALTAARFLEP